ncbi:MAG TPA: glycine betaine ABC transporter substrate-binding protein [Acidimicrobiia bacterium]|nr:glycine betaine ABC transporter substrate-binding protein [Acidimicrobiia bacterium]
MTLGSFSCLARRIAVLAGVLALFGTACGGSDGGSGSGVDAGRGTIVVASKLDTEAQILGRLMAEQLEAKGYDVHTKIPLGGTNIVRKALTSKRIDIYWEFTGSGLNLLGERPIGDPQAAYAKVKELDAANGVTWLPPARLNDTYALAVKGDGPIAARNLSELAGALGSQPGAKVCVDPEGGFREDVLPLLQSAYGISFPETTQLGYELIPPAVAEGRCVAGIVYSTAALILKNGLRVLEDDKAAFGAYTPAPTVLTSRLSRWPNLADDLAALTAALDTPTITALNAQVDVDKLTPQEVARNFLVRRGLVSGTPADKGTDGG